MKIDRAIQQRILQKLYDAYPGGLYPLTKSIDEKIDELSVIANTQYLQDHGLVQSGFRDRNLVGVKPEDRWAEPTETFITAKGIDFLTDDGGLSAILGVVTVKLDASSIKALVLNRIDQADDITHEERFRLKSLVSAAGDQTTRKLVDALIEAGLQAVPRTGELIGMLRGLLA